MTFGARPRDQEATAPAGYLEIERALQLLDLGEGDRWVAAKLHGAPNEAAQDAARLLRAGERREAYARLERELTRLAGPANGDGLGWFNPVGVAPAPGQPR